MTAKSAQQKNKPTWSDVKNRLATLERAELLALLQDLYAASKDNQAFLHARFNMGDDPLQPYKVVISRWICPDVIRNQNFSVAKAKKAVSDYKKALGHPEGLAELAVFYCEECVALLDFCGIDDEGYCSAFVNMFTQALKFADRFVDDRRQDFIERLQRVNMRTRKFGYGVKEDLEFLLAGYDADPQ